MIDPVEAGDVELGHAPRYSLERPPPAPLPDPLFPGELNGGRPGPPRQAVKVQRYKGRRRVVLLEQEALEVLVTVLRRGARGDTESCARAWAELVAAVGHADPELAL